MSLSSFRRTSDTLTCSLSVQHMYTNMLCVCVCVCVFVCVAHCQQGCKHGECVGPDRCKCHPGYIGKTCNQGKCVRVCVGETTAHWCFAQILFPIMPLTEREAHSCHACLTCKGVFYLKTPRTHTHTHTVVSKQRSRRTPPTHLHLHARAHTYTHTHTRTHTNC